MDTEIATLRPDYYAKAGNDTPETLDPQERAALTQAGSEIRILPYLDGHSTTSLIARIARAAEAGSL